MNLAPLKSLAVALRAALLAAESGRDAITATDADVERRKARVACLRDSLDLADDRAVLSFVGERAALELAESRLPDRTQLKRLDESVRDLLLRVPDALRAALQPELESQRLETDAVLADHIADPNARARAVNESSGVRRLLVIMGCSWATFEAVEKPLETARRVLAEVDTVLAGKKPWRSQ